jgi:sulfotransferase
MVKEIFFINGMPRSGSTLLCNILAQNPDFHVTPTSGFSELINGIHQFWKQSPIIKASENPEKQLVIMKDMFQSYHSDTDRKIVFNKSRGWANLIELTETILDKPIKILTTVRPIPNILASMEKLYRKEIKNIASPMQHGSAMNTIDGRLNVWAAADGLVGGTFNAIQDAFYRGHKDKFHLIEYDKLTRSPNDVMVQIYNFIEKPFFQHDFNNVLQYTMENDAEHGFTDLHTIRPKIQPQLDDAREILGPKYDLYSGFNYNFLS